MATDQGKTSNVNGLAAMAALTGRTIDETGTTTYRPPFMPVPMGVIAGRRRGALVNPLRRLPLEAEHRGRWRADARIRRLAEARLVRRRTSRSARSSARPRGRARRSRCSTARSLGKIEVIGPDAAALADFHSYNRSRRCKPGRIRYGFVLQESGVVLDDGVTLRLARDRFLVSCSSGHTDAVRMRLELWRQDRFDPAACRRSRHDRAMGDADRHRPALARPPRGLELDVALDDAEPAAYGASRRAHSTAAPLRVARVSFTGDRSYELSVPRDAGRAFARAPRGEAAGVRRRPHRARGADDPARREGLHRRRQGHRRDDDAARSRLRRARAIRERTNISASALSSCRSPPTRAASNWSA